MNEQHNKADWQWHQVDNLSAPEYYVNYLNTVLSIGFYQELKRKSYDWLKIKNADHIIDIGCGTGDDVIAMARLVGETGRVVGIDNSDKMISEAQKRVQQAIFPIEFYVGSASKLPFPDNTFDKSRSERVLQHLPKIELIITEIVRITKPGGNILIIEPDWDTIVVDNTDKTITRQILNYISDDLVNGWCGRRLPGLFKSAGLVDIQTFPETFNTNDYKLADFILRFKWATEELIKLGSLSYEQGENWLNELERADQEGKFFAAITLFGVTGRKPY